MKKQNSELPLQKAKNTVYRLLKFRPRSELEIITKLKEKEFPQSIIQKVVRYFRELELIDDRAFAKGWISSRIKKPYGKRRILQELKQKGIERSIMDDAWEQAVSNYSEEETALVLAQIRFASYTNVERVKKKQRVFNYLLRKGFSTQATFQAIKKL